MQCFEKSKTIGSLPFFCRYGVDGKYFGSLQEAAIARGEVSLRRGGEYQNSVKRPKKVPRKTMFSEVFLDCEELHPKIAALMDVPCKEYDIDQSTLASSVVAHMEGFIS